MSPAQQATPTVLTCWDCVIQNVCCFQPMDLWDLSQQWETNAFRAAETSPSPGCGVLLHIEFQAPYQAPDGGQDGGSPRAKARCVRKPCLFMISSSVPEENYSAKFRVRVTDTPALRAKCWPSQNMVRSSSWDQHVARRSPLPAH